MRTLVAVQDSTPAASVLPFPVREISRLLLEVVKLTLPLILAQATAVIGERLKPEGNVTRNFPSIGVEVAVVKVMVATLCAPATREAG